MSEGYADTSKAIISGKNGRQTKDYLGNLKSWGELVRYSIRMINQLPTEVHIKRMHMGYGYIGSSSKFSFDDIVFDGEELSEDEKSSYLDTLYSHYKEVIENE
jgi:hypothetical protein